MKTLTKLLTILIVFNCSAIFCNAADTSKNFVPLPAKANYVVFPNERPVAAFGLTNLKAEQAKAELRLYVSDLDGRLVETVKQSLVIPANDTAVVLISPAIAETGYYDARCDAVIEGQDTLKPVYISFVRLREKVVHKKESCFGLYCAGDWNTLENRKPLGFYRYFAKTGSPWTTTDMWWGEAKPAKDEPFDWTHFDTRFADAKAAGLNMLPHLFGVPLWATTHTDYKKGDGVSEYKAQLYSPKEEYWDDWGEFVYAFVNRYKDDLTYLRIWNEYDTAFWRGTIAEFARLLKIAYTQAHRAKPDIKIVIDISMARIPLFQALWQQGGGDYCDIISIHNYQLDKLTPPEETALVSEYKAFVAWRDKNCPDKPVWDSEICWLSEPWSTPDWYGHGEIAHAQYTVRGLLLGFMAGMEKVVYFPYHSWFMQADGLKYTHGGGLVRHDLDPRVAFASYYTMTDLLAETKFARRIDLASDTAYALEFNAPAGIVTVLWSCDQAGEYATFKTQETVVNCVEMLGREHQLLSRNGLLGINLTGNPVYIETTKALEPAVDCVMGCGYDASWTIAKADDSVSDCNVNFKISQINARAKHFYVSLEYPAADIAAFEKRMDVYLDRGAEAQGKIWLPLKAAQNFINAHWSVEQEGAPAIRIPVRIPLDPYNKPMWQADSGVNDKGLLLNLDKPTDISGMFISLPKKCAYDVQCRYDQSNPVELKGATDVLWVAIGRKLKQIEISFSQNLTAPSFEAPAVLHRQGKQGAFWENGSNRDYMTITDKTAHSGKKSIEIAGLGAGRIRHVDEISNVQQFIPIKPDSWYSVSAWMKMPKTEDGQGCLFVIGDGRKKGQLMPHTYAVLPAVGDDWCYMYATVRTEPWHKVLRISASLHGNALMYMDDIMCIEGKLPTDVPEIIDIKLVDDNGRWINYKAVPIKVK